ncbi:hypothetical protein JCM24511_05718 [Saitozyma sp. JCM 24511]|nr:hypothetical protein JCM24511_05718 [Saitozyma sp. JCM 24511]
MTRTTTNHVTWILKHDLRDATKGREATLATRRRGDPHDSGVQAGHGSMGQADLDSLVQTGLDSLVQAGLNSLVQAGLNSAAHVILDLATAKEAEIREACDGIKVDSRREGVPLSNLD